MRVLYCNPIPQFIGGAETYLQTLTHCLKEKQMASFIFNYSNHEKIPFEKLIKEIKHFKPDIIHFNKHLKLSLRQTKIIKGLKKPIVLTVHDFFSVPFPTNIKNKIKLLLNRHYKLVDYFIIPSSSYCNQLKQASVKNIKYIPHFVDVNHWTPNPKRNEKNTLLYIGRLAPHKGLFFLIDTFHNILKKRDDLKLEIIGDGRCRSALLNQIESKGLSNYITIHPFTSHEKIKQHYKEAKILILPTLEYELFGLVGLEAQANQLPSIGSNLKGIKEWCLDHKTGLIFNVGDQDDLILKVNQLLDNKDLYQRILEDGYRFMMENHSPQIVLPQLLKFYNQILSVHNN